MAKKNRGREFEKIIASSFPLYAEKGIAFCEQMPVPMVSVGIHPKKRFPIFTTSGKSPFDVYGFLCGDGRFIGAELKSSQRRTSLPLILPDAKGDGVKYHQLLSLARVHRAGGIARLIWENGGEAGVITGEMISNTERVFAAGMESGEFSSGDKSLRWEIFTPLREILAGSQEYTYDWLLPDGRPMT